jgi:hypothetical protein
VDRPDFFVLEQPGKSILSLENEQGRTVGLKAILRPICPTKP